jgi:predicted glycoside hydrolase/deacetylase ChbG (UPF0249 family)
MNVGIGPCLRGVRWRRGHACDRHTNVAVHGSDHSSSLAFGGDDSSRQRCLIVNADDFGASVGINRAILECHECGVITSASLMVTGRAAKETARMSREHPELSIGLHWDVWGEDEREFSMADERAVRDEFARQLEAFRHLIGSDPTHVDSHKHAHLDRRGRPLALFRELVEPLGVPLRGDGHVRFVGDFYAHRKWRRPDLRLVSIASFQRLLASRVETGWTEILCHPGYRSDDFTSVYLSEREEEVRTLTDARLSSRIEELGIILVSYSGCLVARQL